METSPTPTHDQIDRLSNLPDALLVTILSSLPARMAARTSVLSRRFRHLCDLLWQTSPSLQLISEQFPHRKTSAARFVAMASRILLGRCPSHPVVSLRPELSRYFRFRQHGGDSSFCSSLFVKARSLGVRHLAIDGSGYTPHCPSLPIIFSNATLESLSFSLGSYIRDPPFPSAVTLTNLRSLSIEHYVGEPARLNLLLSQLCALEDFSFELGKADGFRVSSQTIRKFKLTAGLGSQEHNAVELSLPSLESLHVQYGVHIGVHHIRGGIPSLRKAVVNLSSLRKHDCSAVAGLLNSVSHAEELILHIKEEDVICSTPPLFCIFLVKIWNLDILCKVAV